MPARKPSGLSRRHDTKTRKQARVGAEAAMMPRIALSAKPPDSLQGHETAVKIWKRVIALYQQTPVVIITAFDGDLLAKYCRAEEELIELEALRMQIKGLWEEHSRVLKRMKPKGKELYNYFGALAQANALLQRYQGMDARIDGKRKMSLAMAQSLYLTPRSRAGAALPERPKEEPKGEMGKLLDE